MSGDIYLVTPGGRAGDIYVGTRNPSLCSYTITGRVVATDGTPRSGLTITVFERRSLLADGVIVTTTTNARGSYTAEFTLPLSTSWDVFVRAEEEEEDESVDSALLSDLEEGTHTVDIVLGEGEYEGSSEWERITDKLEPLLGTTWVKDVPNDRLEWLAKRADIFPPRLAAYIQAHRLADGRDVKPESCYAFLRAGLPSDLAGLLRVGAAAWEAALRAAWAEDILPLPDSGSAEDQDTEVATEIAAMRVLLVDTAVAIPIEGVNHRLIFDTAGLSVDQQRTYAGLWLNHSGTLAEFWTTVSGSALSAQVPLLQFTIKAAIVARSHIGTLEALQAERITNNISIEDTAEWSVTDWDDLLDAHFVTPPEETPGADATEKRQNYARALFNIVEDTFPTLSLRYSIAREITPPPSTEFLVTFFTNNPEFDIERSTIAVYLNGASSPWTGIDPGDQAEARQNLERVQRLYRLTPRIGRYATTKVLLDNDIGSAGQVVRKTKNEFVQQFGPLFSDDDHHAYDLAEAVWHNGTQIHNLTIGLASQFALGNNNAPMVPIGSRGGDLFEGAGNGLAELSTILGNLDYCACEHCRSVFSPAAYLADLLMFLDDRSALATLSARRPDIEHILLNCTNTNTVLPYIDLVNELLEAYVLGDVDHGPSHIPEDWSNQTTLKEQELRLHPEHGLDVYTTHLATLVHPWTLPFSLPTVEAQTYLRHLGVPRHELMRAFAEVEPEEEVEPEDDHFANGLAADILGMSKTEFDVVVGSYTVPSEDGREFWGFPTDQSNWVDILRGNPLVSGSDIGELLVRASITLEQLQDLLEFDYINPNGNIVVQWAESCALEDASIAFLEAADLDRMHRFIRLQRNSGIPGRMLNVLICDALGGTLDATSLQSLADIVLLKQRFQLGWDVIATWWASVIDPRVYTTGERSLFRRRFMAKDLGNSDLFKPAVDVGFTQLDGETPETPISGDHLPRILAGVGIDDVDYQAIIASSFITPTEPLEGPRFSFANITMMFKIVTLARALKLSVPDFLRLANEGGLIGDDPFASVTATTQFIARVDGIRASGLSIDELDWLLRHEFVGTDPLNPEAIARSLVDLARGLNTIEAESTLLVDPEGHALPGNLAEVFFDRVWLEEEEEETVEVRVAKALAIVDQTTVTDQPGREAFIVSNFVGILDVTIAKVMLANYVTAPALAERRAWLLGKIVGHLRRRALIHDTIASSFGIPADVSKGLITKVLTDPADSEHDTPLFEVFRLPFATEEQIADEIDVESHSNAFAAWTRLAKASLFCRCFKMRADEVEWYQHPGSTDWLALDELPLNAEDTDASFGEWEALRQALDLRGLSRPGEIAFQQVAAASDFNGAMQILADHAGWDAAVMETVSLAIGYDEVEDLVREAAPTRLRRIVEITKRLGVSPVDALAWVTSEPAGTPSMAHAGAIKLAARAKYGEDRWPEIAIPLRDKIRERQRDALVDAVIAITEDFQTSNDVFEHLLIDVEMSHCMMTSRIKQAIASVQIFVHRVLLHLEFVTLDSEELVTFDSESIARWEWMKNYRVWEANRKVFLYPENWIEPELRSNKTPQFRDLESALTRGVLEDALVRRTMGGYLDQLERVANLEIVGVYRHWSQSPNDRSLWLLARTQNNPRSWFLTQRRSTGEWQAWEEIPHQFEGDNVALVVRERRVHLFTLAKIEVPGQGEDGQVDPNKAPGFRVTVGHIERGEDGWSKLSLSEQSTDVFENTEWALRLQVLNWNTLVDLFVYQRPKHAEIHDGVTGLCKFRYRPVNRHIGYVGSVSSEIASTKISLSTWLDFDGQRYAWTRETMPGPTYYRLGTYSEVLFKKAPDDPYRALLYTADVSTEPGFPNLADLTPVVYDDRRRKYLLELSPVPHAPVTDDPPAQAPGKRGKDPFNACTQHSPGNPPAHGPKKKPRRSLRDGLTTPTPLNGSKPGKYDGWQPTDDTEVFLEVGMDVLLGDPEPVGEPGPPEVKLAIEPLYHPYARQMVTALAMQGLDGLFPSETDSPLFRQKDAFPALGPDALHLNTDLVRTTPKDEEYDFRFDSLYGIYNWEIFYHAPMLIASKLTQEQRFEEAQRWHHRIFNPIDLVDEPSSSKYWRLKKFVEEADNMAVNQLEAMLGIGVSPGESAQAAAAFADQVNAWAAAPFDPHAVARIRPGVYQRALLRKYFDNLIAWADNLFRRDTIESITEATVLYILVAELLGPRPQKMPAPENAAQSYAQLEPGLDAFANALVQLEGFIHVAVVPAGKEGCNPITRDPWVRVPVISRFWYFCYPPNPELLKYWDIVADRLFKIRHCQSIEGVERQLPLFEPPIDPGLLVQAVAAGVDFQSVLAELDSGLPPYRFRSVHARALAFTSSLTSLGGALLSALEKQDAEGLSRIRSGHELELLARVREVRIKQRDEAAAAIDAIESSMSGASGRVMHYTRLIDAGYLGSENSAFDFSKKARIIRHNQQAHYAVAGILGAIPQLHVGVPPKIEFGGQHLASIFNAGAAVFGMVASEFEYQAGKASIEAGYERRAEDWAFQQSQALHEVARLRKDLVAAKVRLAIAERELENHELQTEQARSVDDYMRSKFTNLELYNWMFGQLTTLYFQTYQLAFDQAKRAERAYRHELAIPDSEPSIIKYGYWDSLSKGLLAGDKLAHDLQRLDIAYMDRDVRELELRKTISLAQLRPAALQTLQETGTCSFNLPEAIFDLDHPGHYLRRIRGIRLTIPAVVGPYTSLGARLQLDDHRIRKNTNLVLVGEGEEEEEVYAEVPPGDERFIYASGAGRAISTSTAVQDGGVFNLDFKDERYLPFEYAGAISGWTLTLPDGLRQFDYRTIEDVVVHVDYTARYGGDGFRGDVQDEMLDALNGLLANQTLVQVVVGHEAFPNEWEQFFAVNISDNHVLTLPVSIDHFPYFAKRNGITVSQVTCVFLLDSAVGTVTEFAGTLTGIAGSPVDFDQDGQVMSALFVDGTPAAPATMTLTIAHDTVVALHDGDGDLDRTKLVGMAMVIRYSLVVPTP